MKILLINPPYQTLTSNVGVGHQVPLGLLMLGGPLLDAGHQVKLLDAECRRLSLHGILREVTQFCPDMVMTGHAGSTPAHPICVHMLRAIKQAMPSVLTVYGGVFPTYHAEPILQAEPAIDVVVRGEGEATALAVANAVEQGDPLHVLAGVTARDGDGFIVHTRDRPPIHDLDAWRTGWELIEDWDRYRCFGLGRAAIVQYSRGCPHRCTYCGQHGFWVKWRRRNPVRLVDEIEHLHREHGVNFFTLADENPTTLRREWKQLLEELALRKLPVHFFATIRATDIVRDADLLPLYRRAGILYVLMGIESTSDAVLQQVGKRSTSRLDLQACHLLKANGIFSVLGHIVGLQDETRATFAAARRQLQEYNGDYLNAMYVTPHDWTPFGRETAGCNIVEPDQTRWDYRHQVLAQRHLRPWQVFLGVKWLELCFHLRPKRLRAILTERDPLRRRQLWWCTLHTGLVWLGEIAEFAGDRVRRIMRHVCRRWVGGGATESVKPNPRRSSLALPVIHSPAEPVVDPGTRRATAGPLLATGAPAAAGRAGGRCRP